MANDFFTQHRIETYKSMITLSIEGFKFSALANGGAAVALLAYLGNVASKGISAPDMRCTMAAFLAGLASCGGSMLFAYLTQFKLFNEFNDKTPKFSHAWFLWVAIILFFLSLIFFGVGSWQAVVRFR